MSPRTRFTIFEATVFLLVGGLLVVAALRSHELVPEPDPDDVHIPVPAIEPRDQLYAVARPDDATLWLAGNFGKILRSEDDGESWRIQETPTVENLQDLGAWTPRDAVAVGNDGTVLRTTDGGQLWQAVEAPRSEIVNKLFRVQTLSEGGAWAVGAGGMAIVSRDGGATWERRSEREDVAWNGLHFFGPDRGVLVGEFGRIVRTEDGGESWEEIESPVERSLMSVAFRDDEHGVAVGLDGIVLRTDDAGASWTESDAGTPLHLYHVVWDGEVWFVAADAGTVLTAGRDVDSWEAHALAEHELAWHTDAEGTGDGFLLVGATQGKWRQGNWSLLSTREEER